ncbi:MAG: hypothetical protein ACRYHA_30880 [Janthinobacterium lividum]
MAQASILAPFDAVAPDAVEPEAAGIVKPVDSGIGGYPGATRPTSASRRIFAPPVMPQWITSETLAACAPPSKLPPR